MAASWVAQMAESMVVRWVLSMVAQKVARKGLLTVETWVAQLAVARAVSRAVSMVAV